MFEDLTLITCSYNTPDVTITMLKSYYEMNKEHCDNFNLLLMENSTDGETQKLLEENIGLTHSLAVDKALKQCKTKYALLVDTDIIFTKSILDVYTKFQNGDFAILGELVGDRGGFSLMPRINPWYCFINIEQINKCNISFHDQNRINLTKSNGFFDNIPINEEKGRRFYDVGSTFLEDILRNKLTVANAKNLGEYFIHYEGMSWQKQTDKLAYVILGNTVYNKYIKETEKFKNIDINDKFCIGNSMRKKKVDVAINSHKRPMASYLSIKSLMKYSGDEIDKIYFIDDNKDYVDYSKMLNDPELKDKIVYFKPKYNFWVSPINDNFTRDDDYRHSIRYQFAIEKSDKQFLFILHDDIVVFDNIIRAFKDGIDNSIGIGVIGQCKNCPAKKLDKCNSDNFMNYKPSSDELFEMYNSDLPPRWGGCLGDNFKKNPWPLPECRLNEFACLIDLYKIRNNSFYYFGAFKRIDNLDTDTATGWFRDILTTSNYTFKNFDVSKYIYHIDGHPTYFDENCLVSRENECKMKLETEYNIKF